MRKNILKKEREVAMVEEVMVKPATSCPNCHSDLKRIKWNTVSDILICDNEGCSMYHVPRGSIQVPKRSMEEVLRKEESRSRRLRKRAS